jgi:hypothetical protein
MSSNMSKHPDVDTDIDVVHTSKPLIGVFWLYVALPLAWGVVNTLVQATKLFH